MAGPKDFLDAARDPKTTSEQLAQLAASPYSFVRTAVAAHPNARAATLDRLVPPAADTYPDQELLKALASNPSAEPGTLVRIADLLISRLNGGRDNQVAFAAGTALFRRSDTPFDTLLRLLNDSSTSTEFRKVVGRETKRSDVIDVLRQDRSERVRRAAQQNASATGPR